MPHAASVKRAATIVIERRYFLRVVICCERPGIMFSCTNPYVSVTHSRIATMNSSAA